jgi:hypothetical protein
MMRAIKECAGYPCVGKSTEAPDGEIFVAVGNPQTRKRLMELYKDRTQPVLIHPNAVVARRCKDWFWDCCNGWSSY